MTDRIKSGPVEEFVLTDWLRDGWQGMRHKLETKRARRARHFDASTFRAHMRNARKEHLLAIRSLVDSAIECVKGEEKNSRKT
ncbi:MAG: hypothetical protein JXM69_11260 [Anaerolineae bacterium]|nr:hypothetical protein [Anaerolineae bacterium]